ncbi:hypothetical protein WMY93_000764 [Mugilogobius chulae]|uniref:Uncharacterized protein n=1 Tax=Mugilogobius chulae TaxID=88201 RepID=A0AAW0Q076_9GOBI
MELCLAVGNRPGLLDQAWLERGDECCAAYGGSRSACVQADEWEEKPVNGSYAEQRFVAQKVCDWRANLSGLVLKLKKDMFDISRRLDRHCTDGVEETAETTLVGSAAIDLRHMAGHPMPPAN